MMSVELLEQIRSIYPDTKIILCGDIGYQIGCIEGTDLDIQTNLKNFKHVHHYNDFRSKDEATKQIKQQLRDNINNNKEFK